MHVVSFNMLLIVSAIAVVAPLSKALAPWLKVPAVVLEIVAGILVGPDVLGWVHIDEPVNVLALVGLAFLLFLSGLEIDFQRLRGRLLTLAAISLAISLALGLLVGAGLHAAGWVRSPFFLAVTLTATSLGLVVPVLKDARLSESTLGQLTIAGATVADFSAVILLSLFFSESRGGLAGKLVNIGIFIVAIGVVLLVTYAGRNMRLADALVRLQDTTAEIRVRLAVVLVIGLTALAAKVGLETILGAFVAGAILSTVDRDTMSHPNFRTKLDAIGYGFVIPVFFVSSGVRFDLHALTDNPSALARVPVFLLALLVVRGLSALPYAKTVGARGAFVAALLQATSLPFIVTATTIGVSIDVIAPLTAAALVAAGLCSVILFPLVAVALAPSSANVSAST